MGDGRHLIVRFSRSGEEKDLSSYMFLELHHESLIIKHTPLPFYFPERYLFLSARCTENPAGFTDSNRVSRERYGSVKQSMLQAPMSLWKEILALSSSTSYPNNEH